MTPVQCLWLANNPTYSPLAQCHPSFAYLSMQSIDVNGNATPGASVTLPAPGPLSGDENVRSIVVGILTRISP